MPAIPEPDSRLAPAGADAPPPCNVYVMDLSYFSGKLEAYLRYKEIPYQRVLATWRELAGPILRHTGLMKVPVVRTAEGLWLQDSTPIIDWFEARHPEGRVIPDDPHQAFFARLLEDYADEWLWRPALHYRWSFRPDAKLLGDRIATEVLRGMPLPRALRAWRMRRRQRAVYVAGDGVRAQTRAHVESIYLDTLARLERILDGQRFLLGGRPGLADFGFFASMFRHFALDPTPGRIMRERAPGVFAWVARLWNARRTREPGAFAPPGTLPEGWDALLADAGSGYLPYLHANAAAFREGRERFDADLQGAPYRELPVVRYRVWCRERLQEHFEALPDSARPAVRATLEKTGCWKPLWRDGRIASGLHEGEAPPICNPPRLGLRQRLGLAWNGTTWGRAEARR